MQTHDARCAYKVTYRCRRCGKLSPSAGKLERTECPEAGER